MDSKLSHVMFVFSTATEDHGWTRILRRGTLHTVDIEYVEYLLGDTQVPVTPNGPAVSKKQIIPRLRQETELKMLEASLRGGVLLEEVNQKLRFYCRSVPVSHVMHALHTTPGLTLRILSPAPPSWDASRLRARCYAEQHSSREISPFPIDHRTRGKGSNASTRANGHDTFRWRS